MAEIKLESIKKSYGRTEVIHGIDADIATASSSSSSVRRAAASQPCCAWSPALNDHLG
jgi:hypothetical protein